VREISLDRLRTLVMVAKLGSFSEAARLLNLSPPTVSLHISDLEARVGGALLIRARAGVRPTSAGQTLIARSAKLLEDAEQALFDVQRQIQGLSGRVRICSSTGVIAHLLPFALEILKHQHPDIDIEVSVLTSHETLNRLSDGTLELGIVALPQSLIKGLRIEPWRHDPILAFIPAAWDAPDIITPAWLVNKPLVLNEGTTHLSRLTSEWFSQIADTPSPRVEINYNDALKSLVAAGYGATLLPHEKSAPLPDHRVQMRPLSPPLWRHLGIAFRDDHLDQATRLVLEVLRELRSELPASNL